MSRCGNAVPSILEPMRALAVLVVGGTFASSAFGLTWKFGGFLSPPGSRQSEAYAVNRSQAAGWDWDGTRSRSILWSPRMATRAYSLSMPNAPRSIVYGLGLGMQVGVLESPQGRRAVLWRGSPTSMVNLHPDHIQWTGSEARATDGVYQVGTLWGSNGRTSGAIWSGNAGTLRLLQREMATATQAADMKNRLVAGSSTINGRFRATSWAVSDLRVIDWHPASAVASMARATDGRRLGGYTSGGGLPTRAALFPVPGALVDLHPTTAHSSIVLGMSGNLQVGNVYRPDSTPLAVVWTGTRASMRSLHSLVRMPGLQGTSAYGVFTDGFGNAYVVGSAYARNGLTQAVWWYYN